MAKNIKKTPASPVAAPAAAAAPKAVAAPQAAERSELKGSGTAKAAGTVRNITQEQIARRAFEIYAGRGYAAGDQTADWLEAERQLKAGL